MEPVTSLIWGLMLIAFAIGWVMGILCYRWATRAGKWVRNVKEDWDES